MIAAAIIDHAANIGQKFNLNLTQKPILKNITQWLYFIIHNLDYPMDGTTGGRVSDIG